MQTSNPTFRFVILAQDNITACALAQIAMLDEATSPVQIAPTAGEVPPPDALGVLSENVCVVPPGSMPAVTFPIVHEFLLKCALAYDNNVRSQGRQVTVLVDAIEAMHLHPFSATFSGLVSMLILAFPEFHWVFGVVRTAVEITGNLSGAPPTKVNATSIGKTEDKVPTANMMAQAHSIDTLLTQLVPDPLFDGDGLRQYVRKLAKDADPAAAGYLPVRKELATAIDDEIGYAYFHAYAAYRFGFRAYAITTERAATLLLHDGAMSVDLTIEDLYMNFADRTLTISLSDLSERDAKFKALAKAEFRLFVTTGQQEPGAEGIAKAERNGKKLNDLESRKCGALCYKPTGGIFGLWEKSGLRYRWHGGGKHPSPGFAPSFVWPPEAQECQSGTKKGNHSAPGKLLEISTLLRTQAERILAESRSVDDSIRAAVLATEALELLGERTPTSSLGALALKHKAEVTAACQFYGTEFNLHVTPRLEELRKEIHRIGEWFHSDRRKEAEANAELGIVSDMAAIFREYTQFCEEQVCLARVRDLHRQVWFGHHWVYNWLLVPRLGQWYIDFLLRSIAHFVAASVVWVVLLAACFWVCDLPHGSWQGMQHALYSFFCQGKPSHAGASDNDMVMRYAWEFGVVMLSTVSGMFHFGVLLSHLYALSSRR